jgi:hypothetical protein
VARHRPARVASVVKVVDLGLGVAVVVVVAQRDKPGDLQRHVRVHLPVGLFPKRVRVAGDPVLVEVVTEHHRKTHIHLGSECGHLLSYRSLSRAYGPPVTEGYKCEVLVRVVA